MDRRTTIVDDVELSLEYLSLLVKLLGRQSYGVKLRLNAEGFVSEKR